MTGRLSEFLSWAAEKADRSIGWWRLPEPLAILVLIGLRDRLRTHNLYDTGRGPLDKPSYEDPNVANHVTARMLNGTYNDVRDPLMGSLGSRFGRNVPLTHTRPEQDDRLLDPNPRLISQRLLKREEFQPATTLNLLAAAWIQFEVHDWLSHGPGDSQPRPIEVEDKEWDGERPMLIKRDAPDPSPEPGPPTFVTQDTHWWDGSQIYGRNPDYADGLRDDQNKKGKLRIDDDSGLPPADLDNYLDFTGPAGNFWLGLAILHSLFIREHNAICERLAAEYPDMTDQDLYDKARLVNAALMAKIHTLEWTPAIIAHPTTVYAMHANWFGVLGERFRRHFGRITNSEILQGIPGSPTDHFGVPYSLTEEFVAVYRMHPLIPDHFVFRSVVDNSVKRKYDLPKLTVDPESKLQQIRDRISELKMDNIFYSFGRSCPGALNLHNFPTHLQQFKRADGSLVDLATIDIVRVRERGVPRYNEFRRLLRLKPASSFEELTDNPDWARELREIYGDVERVDLMIGLYAERKPPGFGFSDTAFRIFMLMASRRLNSDRFFTRDFRPEIYTQAGMGWVNNNTMRTVLLRHFPSLEPALRGVKNPFAPWARVGGNTKPTYLTYNEDLERRQPCEDKLVWIITRALHWNNKWALRKYNRAIRDAHPKSHGILGGKLIVHKHLPHELQEGLFTTPGEEFDVIARLSSTSGAIRSDQLRGVRGLGIKVLGVNVKGEREPDTGLANEANANTQDFVLVTHREFPFADVRAYALRGMVLAWLLARLPDSWLGLFSRVLDAAVKVGLPLSPILGLLVLPNNHILGETFYSSAPLRYGRYVAKMCVAPLSASVKALEGLPVTAGYDAHRDEVIQFFESNEAEYELRVQLCTDTVGMPIEDASVEWPESVSPYRGVATIKFHKQNVDSPARRFFGDEVLSFNSWRTLTAHRPLGSINRLKKQVYEASSNFRHEKNHVERSEPATIAELPD